MSATVTKKPSSNGVHHIGHSTHCIVFDDVAVLTDPWVLEPADHVLVHTVPPAPLPINPDIVFISHAHGDHFDPCALGLISNDSLVLAPTRRIARAVRALGFSSVKVPEIGEVVEVGGVTITIGRGRHLGREIICHIACADGAVFFGGDSMLTDELRAFARQHPADLAILPAERSSFFGRRTVMGPKDSSLLADALTARRVVLSHHESIIGTRNPLAWFVRVDVAHLDELDDRWVIPAPGDHIRFPWQEEPLS